MIEAQHIVDRSHAFLDSQTKKMLIDGKWVESVSGKTFDVFDPTTGDKIAEVFEAMPEVTCP